MSQRTRLPGLNSQARIGGEAHGMRGYGLQFLLAAHNFPTLRRLDPLVFSRKLQQSFKCVHDPQLNQRDRKIVSPLKPRQQCAQYYYDYARPCFDQPQIAIEYREIPNQVKSHRRNLSFHLPESKSLKPAAKPQLFQPVRPHKPKPDNEYSETFVHELAPSQRDSSFDEVPARMMSPFGARLLRGKSGVVDCGAGKGSRPHLHSVAVDMPYCAGGEGRDPPLNYCNYKPKLKIRVTRKVEQENSSGDSSDSLENASTLLSQ